MAVKDILDELENLVVDAKHLIFTNKSIVEENDIIRLVEDLRTALPAELSDAQRVVEERDAIISAAKDEAARIVEQAKSYAANYVDNDSLVAQTQEKAQSIMTQTRNQEKEILEKAIADANQLHNDADRYASQMFDYIIANVGGVLQAVQQAKAQHEQGRQRQGTANINTDGE